MLDSGREVGVKTPRRELSYTMLMRETQELDHHADLCTRELPGTGLTRRRTSSHVQSELNQLRQMDVTNVFSNLLYWQCTLN